MMNISENNLEDAVKVICGDVYEKIDYGNSKKLCENDLWREMICCVLSSQVSYETAKSFSIYLFENCDIGKVSKGINTKALEKNIRKALKKRIFVNGSKISYRFPNIRAKQLSNIHEFVFCSDTNLSNIIYSTDDAYELRELLINNFSGIGPKQASMFIRNIGFSYDLAILDRHVIHFMNMINLDSKNQRLGKKEYFSLESKLINYAKNLGYPVGFVDWSIWIVMRVALREGYI